MGLAFDEQDLEYYTALFTRMGRDPTNVELFDIAQSNSEHSRHWFFGVGGARAKAHCQKGWGLDLEGFCAVQEAPCT